MFVISDVWYAILCLSHREIYRLASVTLEFLETFFNVSSAEFKVIIKQRNEESLHSTTLEAQKYFLVIVVLQLTDYPVR